jgi:hypothetical protein
MLFVSIMLVAWVRNLIDDGVEEHIVGVKHDLLIALATSATRLSHSIVFSVLRTYVRSPVLDQWLLSESKTIAWLEILQTTSLQLAAPTQQAIENALMY